MRLVPASLDRGAQRVLSRLGRALLAASAAALTGCSPLDSASGDDLPVDASATDAAQDPGDATPSKPELVPAGPRLFRLTARQYRNTVRDLFGPSVVPPPALEPDRAVDGLLAVGATVSSLSSRGVEQYFDAALTLADQVLSSNSARGRVLACGTEDEACTRDSLAHAGRLIWRRPLTDAELEGVFATATKAHDALGNWEDGLRYGLAHLLQSPEFVYRVEVGDPVTSAYAPYELASRVSYFLWNSTPDQALLDAAESGELLTDEGLSEQVDRMLADARARDGVGNFFAEWLALYDLDALTKDPNIFRHYSADLGARAREETLRLVDYWVFEKRGDFRELFTTRTTFVDRRLAAIYDVPAPEQDTFGMVELPPTQPRRGILGHVSLLAHFSHPTSSSATLRGKFVRERLLCGVPLSPPANLNTAIPEPSADARTLKERLVKHMEVEECGACHRQLDPIGFGLENFDGIGRFRTEDNGALIDPSGTLDGEPFNDAVDLVTHIANHPKLAPCFVRNVYAYANGHLPELGEASAVQALQAGFAADGFNVLDLFRAVALSPGFRQVTPLAEEEVSQ